MKPTSWKFIAFPPEGNYRIGKSFDPTQPEKDLIVFYIYTNEWFAYGGPFSWQYIPHEHSYSRMNENQQQQYLLALINGDIQC